MTCWKAQVITKRWEGRCWRCHCFNIYNQSFKFRVITNHYLPVTTRIVTSFVTRVLPPKGNALKDNLTLGWIASVWRWDVCHAQRYISHKPWYLSPVANMRWHPRQKQRHSVLVMDLNWMLKLGFEVYTCTLEIQVQRWAWQIWCNYIIIYHRYIYIYKSNTITKNHPHKHIIHIGISDTNHPGSGSIFAYFFAGKKTPQNHWTSVESLPLIPCIALSELPQNLFHRCTTFTFLGWKSCFQNTHWEAGFGGNWSCWKK